jgi:hypothetical protein
MISPEHEPNPQTDRHEADADSLPNGDETPPQFRLANQVYQPSYAEAEVDYDLPRLDDTTGLDRRAIDDTPNTEPFRLEHFAPQPDDVTATDEIADLSEPAVQPPISQRATTIERDFEDLTLAELTGQIVREPRKTLSLLMHVVRSPSPAASTAVRLPIAPHRSWPRRDPAPAPDYSGEAESAGEADRAIEPEETEASGRMVLRLALYLLAFGIAWLGNNAFVASADNFRFEANQLSAGMPFLILGFAVWAGTEWFLRQRTAARRTTPPRSRAIDLFDLDPLRVAIGFAGGSAALLAWAGTAGNRFTTDGVLGWVVSITLILIAVAPREWTFRNFALGIRHWAQALDPRRYGGALLALIGILILGAIFRLYDFSGPVPGDGTPPEMTSDHVEKIRDAERIRAGSRDVFFVNNGGREPFQFYTLAFISTITSAPIDFNLLKFLSVLEGMITLPVLWLTGREVIGPRDRRLGNLVGLAMAGLVAVSYWHVALSRLSLRIVLTPLVAGLLLIFLARAIRFNRRSDFIYAGLTLGFGMYMYQAVRMLPLVVLAAVGIAILFRWKDRAARTRYVVNLAVLVLVSLIVFVPLARFWFDYPSSFWMRTQGRFFGDDVIFEQDAAGNIIERQATLSDRIAAFNRNLPVLATNIRNALLMYNWKGDVAWINGAPNYPAMDSFTNSLLVVGLAGWLALIMRTRDPVYALVPVMLFIMLLPSALSIAYPIENPSATRTSGSLPAAYLLAAFPLGVMAYTIQRLLNGLSGKAASYWLMAVIFLAALALNWNLYFGTYKASYAVSSYPYSEPGQMMREFVEQGGSFGNIFMIAAPYWWDHRAIGMEAGINDWPNGIAVRENTPNFIYEAWQCRTGPYRFDPEGDLLFFIRRYESSNEEWRQDAALTLTAVERWFPDGRLTEVTSYQTNTFSDDDFGVYHVPALGLVGMTTWVDAYTTERACDFVG